MGRKTNKAKSKSSNSCTIQKKPITDLEIDENFHSKAEKVQVLDIVDIVIKQEVLTDDEYEFEFKIDDDAYFNIVKELRDKDDDLIDSGEVRHKCAREGCEKMFKTVKSFRSHMKQHEISSFCHLCGFLVEGDLSHHLKNHDKKPKAKPKCDLCGKEFRKMIYLRNHLKTHEDSDNYECQWCLKKLKTYENLQYHLRRHVNVKEFICDLCGREMSNIELYNKHMKTHGTNNKFRCNICFMSFNHQSTLCRHSRIHSQTFFCNICNEKFSFDSHLRRHLLEAHRDLNAISMPRLTPKHINYRDRRSKKSLKPEESDSSSSEATAYNEKNSPPKIIDVYLK